MTGQVQDLTVHAALGGLIQAGPAGLTTTSLAELFSYPESYHQRSNRVSQIMKLLAQDGCAVFAGTEPSPLYKHGPVSRWRVTPAGIERHKTSRPRLSHRQRKAELAALSERQAAAEQAQREALAVVRAELAVLRRACPSAPVPLCWRARKIRQLRAVPCTLTEIGALFRITRERVRQIEMTQEKPCPCQECRNRDTPGARGAAAAEKG